MQGFATMVVVFDEQYLLVLLHNGFILKHINLPQLARGIYIHIYSHGRIHILHFPNGP